MLMGLSIVVVRSKYKAACMLRPDGELKKSQAYGQITHGTVQLWIGGTREPNKFLSSLVLRFHVYLVKYITLSTSKHGLTSLLNVPFLKAHLKLAVFEMIK